MTAVPLDAATAFSGWISRRASGVSRNAMMATPLAAMAARSPVVSKHVVMVFGGLVRNATTAMTTHTMAA